MNRSFAAQPKHKYLVTRRDNEGGFALLEVLLAFLVLALGLGIILGGISGAVRADIRSEGSLAGMRVAQSRLDAAGLTDTLVLGRRRGQLAKGYTWQQTVTQIDMATPEQHGTTRVQGPDGDDLTPLWVEVTVRAKDGTVTRLAALKLKSKPTK